MAKTRFPLGGQSKDHDSIKSRAEIINLIPEMDKDGSYETVRRTEGLTTFATLSEGPVRSEPLVNNGWLYVVSGSILYRVSKGGTVSILGTVNGSGRAVIKANAIPGDSEISILNGSGSHYIYDDANGLVATTDTDFFASSGQAVLNEVFWFVRDGRNQIFGSGTSVGGSFDPLRIISAEENPDNVVAVQQIKSALWVIGEETSQYFQGTTDTTLPLRAVRGASKPWGAIAKNSVAGVNDWFCFLADDRTVRMVTGTEIKKISDLSFELRIKGNGTAMFPGFSTVDDAIGFFVDGPTSSVYCLTFPTEKYTWCFDVNTGMPHRRESNGLGKWRVNGAVKFFEKIICGDSEGGTLWVLDPSNRTENDEILRSTLVTPSMAWSTDVVINSVDIEMEVAQMSTIVDDANMLVYYTKDGGNTYIAKETISLGDWGQHSKRISIRNMGRVVRHKDFAMKFVIAGVTGAQFYGAYIDADMSI